MDILEIVRAICVGGVALSALVDISPIKLDPWKWLFRKLGKVLNGEVLAELEKTQKKLEAHIQADDERDADTHRARILRFNNELLRDIPHTKEDFINILADIDDYKAYCRDHEEYKNSRAVHAIANIEKNYDKRLEKHDFAK